MSKIITEELIQERLEDKGVTVPHETSQGDKISKLELEYGFNIVNDWQGCDAYFYTDETRDGYQIWIASEQEGNVCINEDVYYYDTQWFEKLEYGFEEVIEAMYEELYMESHEEIEIELRDEGYEFEKK